MQEVKASFSTEDINPKRRLALAFVGALPWLLLACGREQELSRTLVGQALPRFSLPDLTGRLQDLGTRRNGPVVLNFWATWCPPCRAEMAGLERMHQALGPRGLRLIGITVDEDLNLVREYLLKEAISFPIYHDPKAQTTSPLLGTSALPMTILVGQDGRIRQVILGERRWDEAPAREWLEGLLA